MGSASGKELIKNYWVKSRKGLTQSQDSRAIRKCFDAYDINGSGALEREEAMTYITDLLRVSGIEKRVFGEAEKAGLDPQTYFKEYVQNIFKEMDRNNNGKIEFDELLKPKEHLVNDFIRLVSTQTLHELKRDLNPNKKHKPTKMDDDDGESSGELASESDESDPAEPEENPDKPPRRPSRVRKPGKASKAPAVADPVEAADDSDDLDDNGDKHRSLPKKPANEITKPTAGRKALTESGLLSLREKMVDAVVEVLGVEPYQAQALLNHFKWDKDRTLTEYFDKAEEICKTIGIDPPKESKLASLRASSKAANKDKIEDAGGKKEPLECSICYDDADDWTELPACHHKFCDSCWAGNLSVQIKEGHTLDIHCMHQGCTQLVPDYLVRKLVPQDVYKKYAQFVSKRFVENNKALKWCPAPNCGRAITEPTYEGDNVIGVCTCGKTFCWKCGDDAHTPIPCDMVGKWNEACKKDLGTIKWIAENTKPCPKCKSQIQKNDGCFQMTCSQCYHQFCWLCLDAWSTHTDHFRCAKYGDNTPQNTVEWRDGGPNLDALVGSDDYFTWYNRWTEYERALALEKEHWVETEKKIRRLKEHNVGIDPTFLVEAHEQLQKNRRILKYLSAMLCLTKNKVQQELSSQFHGQLEMLTEKLAQKSEKETDIAKMSAAEIRELTRISRLCLANLLGDDE